MYRPVCRNYVVINWIFCLQTLFLAHFHSVCQWRKKSKTSICASDGTSTVLRWHVKKRKLRAEMNHFQSLQSCKLPQVKIIDVDITLHTVSHCIASVIVAAILQQRVAAPLNVYKYIVGSDLSAPTAVMVHWIVNQSINQFSNSLHCHKVLVINV